MPATNPEAAGLTGDSSGFLIFFIDRAVGNGQCQASQPTPQHKSAMIRYRKIAVAALSLLMGGCASIVSKSTTPVTITSSPPGARVSITNARREVVHTGVAPVSGVVLRSSDGYFRPAVYTVAFSKAGYAPQTVPLVAGMNGWYAGNIIVGGLIGMLIVDPMTGAMWRLPDSVNANLQKNGQ